jgi:hypothetical protein
MVSKERNFRMSLDLRVLLIVASVLMLLAVVLRIRKSKFQIRDGVFWFLLSALFLVMSIFPQLVMSLSGLIGFESPANLVFLGIIAIVLVKNFLLSVKVSQLEYNLMKLTQHTMVESVSEEGKAKEEQKK